MSHKRPAFSYLIRTVATSVFAMISSILILFPAHTYASDKIKKSKETIHDDTLNPKSMFDSLDSPELTGGDENDFAATQKILKQEENNKHSEAELDGVVHELQKINERNEERQRIIDKKQALKEQRDRERLKEKLAKQKKLEEKWRRQVNSDSRFPDFDEDASWNGLYGDH